MLHLNILRARINASTEVISASKGRWSLGATKQDADRNVSLRTSKRLASSLRRYSLKPLTVEGHFPKLDKSIPPPSEIKLKKSERVRFLPKVLYVKWNEGCEVKLPAEYLRVESPSAEVQGHGGADEKRLIFGRKFVNIIGIEPQGHYGVLLKFDDLHDSGIYSWEYLRYLGENKFGIMKRYILNLRRAGKHRDPRLNTTPRPKPKPQL